MSDISEGEDPFQTFFTDKAYRQALDMVSEAVAYQEAEGILERDALEPKIRAVFISESMRLTTRLMQIVSWFLAQRAVQQGELTAAEALGPSRRLGAIELCLAAAPKGAESLPKKMKDLLDRSRSLFEQILRMEAMMTEESKKLQNPVHNLIDRLK